MTLTLKHLTRLKSLHQRIKSAQTGTPARLAKSLHISQRTLREDLELVKHWGGEICYDRKNTTYYYCNDFDLKIGFDVIAITEGQQQHIYGGMDKKHIRGKQTAVNDVIFRTQILQNCAVLKKKNV